MEYGLFLRVVDDRDFRRIGKEEHGKQAFVFGAPREKMIGAQTVCPSTDRYLTSNSVIPNHNSHVSKVAGNPVTSVLSRIGEDPRTNDQRSCARPHHQHRQESSASSSSLQPFSAAATIRTNLLTVKMKFTLALAALSAGQAAAWSSMSMKGGKQA